ncbi:pectinesterase family protein [Uliginosibacterium sp. H3]|uniref:Pectinesterase family protein n=1 Tax=Uliginosibacterium silvisoli TaxID=3114758 RepID=A0ABU6K2K7_9RHOO|nr:pectinesterase family protein [Uliginosibacterium sp. H3]
MNPHRRLYLGASLAFPLTIMLEGCASTAFQSAAKSALVDAGYSGKAGAIVDGVAQFKTVQQALDAAPDNSPTPWRIAIRNGRYYEKLEITKPNIRFIGESRDKTILTFDAYSGLNKPGGGGAWGTNGCATLIVRATDFAALDITIENGFDYPANDKKDPKDPTYTNAGQAVAVMTAKGADRSFFANVKITGHQDTLFVDAGRSLFRKCYVSGNVDFIFGAGQSVFEECEIVTRPRTKPGVNPVGYVTAPSTQISNPYGLVFVRCKLIKENGDVPAESSPLGRPWHPTTTMPDGRYADPNAIGSSVFIECFMEDHITSDGWAAMAGTQKSGPDRVWFQPEDSRFFEYKSSGPGAKTGAKRRQLSDAQAADYAIPKLLGDWKP